MTNEVILPDDSRAAVFFTIAGWKDRNGTLYVGEKAEEVARNSGATHVHCTTCGAVTPKPYTVCEECREKLAVDRYEKRSFVEWDGKTPIYSESHDFYFDSPDDLRDYCEEHDVKPFELRLLLCIPIRPPRVDAEDIMCDCLPEETEIPDEIYEAFERLNAVLAAYSKPLGWEPGNNAVIV